MHRTLTVLLLALLASQVAAEEKVIRMYNWNDYIAPQVLVDFEKKTGIRVDYSTFSSAEELDEAMASNQPFDIIVPSNDLLPNLIRNGKLTPLDKTKLVNSKHLDRQLLGKLSAFDPKNRYAIPYLWGSIGLAINTPKAEADLADHCQTAGAWCLTRPTAPSWRPAGSANWMRRQMSSPT